MNNNNYAGKNGHISSQNDRYKGGSNKGYYDSAKSGKHYSGDAKPHYKDNSFRDSSYGNRDNYRDSYRDNYRGNNDYRDSYRDSGYRDDDYRDNYRDDYHDRDGGYYNNNKGNKYSGYDKQESSTKKYDNPYVRAGSMNSGYGNEEEWANKKGSIDKVKHYDKTGDKDRDRGDRVDKADSRQIDKERLLKSKSIEREGSTKEEDKLRELSEKIKLRKKQNTRA